MNDVFGLTSSISAIESKIGYRFKDRSLLTLAFIHRSCVNESRLVTSHNERLEFLGDSILGMVTAEYVYLSCPNVPEGELSSLRSRLVEAASCVTYLKKLGVEDYILLGKGERLNDGRGRESILADLFEAIIGAIYLDGGIEAVKTFYFSHFLKEIEAILENPMRNWKALLQDYCQKKYQSKPIYELQSALGPEHSRLFTVVVMINHVELGRGSGASKKEAQQKAAADAIVKLEFKETKNDGAS